MTFSSYHLPIALLVLSVASHLPILASCSSNGFSIELIHRDSPKSPLYDPKSTYSSRIRAAAERSRSRAIYFRDAIHKSRSSSSALPMDDADNFYSEITPNTFEYLMSFYLGTPTKKILAIADTGSDLIWVQCAPCNECYSQTAPLFDPQASSTYKTISCNTDPCSILPQSSCGPSLQCYYQYGYGDRSIVEGYLSTETIGFDSTSGRPVQIPTTLFGCTHQSNGTFDKNDAGLVGLGGGKLSLIRQLGSTIGSKFSYCLPSSTQTSETSKLNFGSNAVVSGSNAVTTPLISGSPDTFYFLSLEHISVAGKIVTVEKPTQIKASAQGNIIIDSGTTLTLLDDNTLQSVESNVKSSVSLSQVTDPNGVFNLCFDVSGSGASAQFPEITFQFSGGASVVLQQSNAFVEASQNILCLAMVSSGSTPDSISIFGNIAQQNFHIGYDLSSMQLTFAPTDCATV
ncbi:aspartic proteinase CDR1-like [Phalaenopsis equestris]|uniref:aspartic proteinase CDR1-like n=1 Tax=Phalaenopsis equestris TaxID=78828 RepID=UPI0009E483A6|nr:aspartic proteinase CDR1-like [Phalaenopsis equestris]